MKYKIKKGRPGNSRNIRITPEFRDEPDIDKLGRALVAVTLKILEKKTADEASPPEQEDDMT